MSSSTASVPPPAPPAPASHLALDAMGAARAEFDHLRGRARRGIWIETLGVFGLLLVAYAVPTLLTDRFLRLETVFRLVLLGTFGAVVLVTLRRRLFRPLAVRLDDDEMALAVERRAPDMQQALISALQFDRTMREAATQRESHALMAAVVADTNARLRSIPFDGAIDTARIRKYAGGILLCLGFFLGWGLVDVGSLGIWANRNLLLGSVEWPRYTVLEFADSAQRNQIAQGDALTVRVKATGELPEQVFLSYEFDGGDSGTEPMSNTGDGEFTLTLPAMLEGATLRAEGGDALPVELEVAVVERPRIEGLELTIGFPDYMERDPEVIPATEGDIRLPRGATLDIEGRSHKPLQEAFALLGDDRKIPLERGADGHSFAGRLRPEASGLLEIGVVDTDSIGAGAPPKFLLRVGDDREPRVDFRLRGIGSLISTHARIPGDLKAKDDFGLRDIDASMRATEGDATESRTEAGTPLPDVPFENVAATYGDPIAKNATRYETAATVDLRQWNPEPDENSKNNRVRPGMLLSLRFGATDNFGPGAPHHGYSEVMTFRVVTRERLFEDLRRRQVEQRDELQRIADEHDAALLELRETVNPEQAGDRAREARARFKALARQQVALGRRAAFIAESYQRILWEYENNRLIDSPAVREMESLIPVPLDAVAKDAFPVTGRLVGAFADSAQEPLRDEAVSGYEGIAKRIAAILKEMQKAETIAALLEDLRVVINIEDSVRRDVENKARESEAEVLGTGKGKDGKDDNKDTKKR